MGDQADYLIDQMMDDPYEMEREDGDGPAMCLKTCRCCGVSGLHWEGSGSKWRLYDMERKIHVCTVAPLKDIKLANGSRIRAAKGGGGAVRGFSLHPRGIFEVE